MTVPLHVIAVSRTPHGWEVTIPGRKRFFTSGDPVRATAQLLARDGVDVEGATFEFRW
jgi:hypothetical protein